MIQSLRIRTPAKINLFLHITGRRADGYHLLQSVFRAIDLCDTLDLVTRADGVISRSAGPSDIAAEADLCIRAAKLLQQHTACRLGCDIALQKVIPSGAGLGGGSSNAAGVLKALNQLWQTGLSNTELHTLGLQLGADVPFFIAGHDQWAEGVGEQLSAIDLPAAAYVVLYPRVHCPTPLLFSQPDLKRNCEPLSPSDFLSGCEHENVFEKVAERLYPEIGVAKAWLAKQCGSARMTGSGSALFAQFDSHTQAQDVLANCPLQWLIFYARSCAPSSQPAFDSKAPSPRA